MGKKEDFEERAWAAIRYWTTMGDPIRARDVKRALDAGTDIDPSLLNLTNIRPRAGVDIVDVGEIPNRSGRGSGVDKWRAFATAASDLDPEVIEAMTRDDLIAALEAAGVIPAADEEEYEEEEE